MVQGQTVADVLKRQKYNQSIGDRKQRNSEETVNAQNILQKITTNYYIY